MQPVAVILAVAAGAVILAHALKREWQRVNRELDAVRVRAGTSRTLRRDPKTGIWQPD